MAILFFKKTSREGYLATILFVLVLLLSVVWVGSFAKKHMSLPQAGRKEVKIDFQALENKKLQALVPLLKVPQEFTIIGRSDPFYQYSLLPGLSATSSTSLPNSIK